MLLTQSVVETIVGKSAVAEATTVVDVEGGIIILVQEELVNVLAAAKAVVQNFKTNKTNTRILDKHKNTKRQALTRTQYVGLYHSNHIVGFCHDTTCIFSW